MMYQGLKSFICIEVKVNSAAVYAYIYEHKEAGTGYVQLQKLEISAQAARYQVPQEYIEHLL